MKPTRKVEKILSHYSSDNVGTITNLARILMHGFLGGTGKLVILPVDQGFEHGPDRSFAKNPESYDPDYHFRLAIDAKLNAYAAPLGMFELSSQKYAGYIPTILKLNSSNSLESQDSPNQAITASVADALRLGCSAVGLTIYPGSPNALTMIEEAREVVCEAKSCGLATVIWSYPRGGKLTKEAETAIDVCAYSAHMAALIGAHIIKVKLPTNHLGNKDSKLVYEEEKIDISTLSARVGHVMKTSFNGKRIVVFSGGGAKSEKDILEETKAIASGGANGSIIGRNSFQRPYKESLQLLHNICNIYRNS